MKTRELIAALVATIIAIVILIAMATAPHPRCWRKSCERKASRVVRICSECYEEESNVHE